MQPSNTEWLYNWLYYQYSTIELISSILLWILSKSEFVLYK